MEAARHWAARGQSSGSDETQADLEAWGAPQDVMEQFAEAQPDTDFEVYQENWQTVLLFLQVQSQWRMGMNGPVGLDYSAVQLICSINKQALTPELMEGLQIMEMAALAAMNKKD